LGKLNIAHIISYAERSEGDEVIIAMLCNRVRVVEWLNIEYNMKLTLHACIGTMKLFFYDKIMITKSSMWVREPPADYSRDGTAQRCRMELCGRAELGQFTSYL
jgi:hypothetical protein